MMHITKMTKQVFYLIVISLSSMVQAQTGSAGFKSEFYNFPLKQKLGMCYGYHLFWATLSKVSRSYEDMRFSLNVSRDISARVGSDREFSNSSAKTIEILNNAAVSGNNLLVKQVAGVCHELGYPVGQNTRN